MGFQKVAIVYLAHFANYFSSYRRTSTIKGIPTNQED